MTRLSVPAVFGLLWLSLGVLSALFLCWAFKSLDDEPPAPLYPLDMWRHRRDVTVLRPPDDQDKDDGSDVA